MTATASFRFSKYMADWLDLTGTKILDPNKVEVKYAERKSDAA